MHLCFQLFTDFNVCLLQFWWPKWSATRHDVLITDQQYKLVRVYFPLQKYEFLVLDSDVEKNRITDSLYLFFSRPICLYSIDQLVLLFIAVPEAACKMVEINEYNESLQ